MAFVSASPDLVPNDTHGAQDVFLRDRTLQVTERVSLAADGCEVPGDRFGPLSLSGDARRRPGLHPPGPFPADVNRPRDGPPEGPREDGDQVTIRTREVSGTGVAAAL